MNNNQANPTRSVPDFDLEHLNHYTSGDVDLQREVLQLFYGQVESLVERLVPTGKPSEWFAAAHAIKGGAKALGLLATGELCEQLESLKDEPVSVKQAACEKLIEGLAVARLEVIRHFPGIFAN